MNLSVADGFKFGCGLFLASGFALASVVLVVALAMFIANLAGVQIPFPGS